MKYPVLAAGQASWHLAAPAYDRLIDTKLLRRFTNQDVGGGGF